MTVIDNSFVINARMGTLSRSQGLLTGIKDKEAIQEQVGSCFSDLIVPRNGCVYGNGALCAIGR